MPEWTALGIEYPPFDGDIGVDRALPSPAVYRVERVIQRDIEPLLVD